MGQKINPTGFRLAVTRDWNSRWYASNREFGTMLAEDLEVRKYLEEKLGSSDEKTKNPAEDKFRNASVARVLIERPAKNARITIYTARPGAVIGRKGEGIEMLRADLAAMLGVPVTINIEEVRRPEVNAQLIADSVTQQLEKRIQFRRAMKRSMQNAMRAGVQGIKVQSSGRLNGADIARREWYREGQVPLHTLRANIDYATSEAYTTYGIIGVKVWVYMGEYVDGGVFGAEQDNADAPERKNNRRRSSRGGRGRGAASNAAPADANEKPAVDSAEQAKGE